MSSVSGSSITKQMSIFFTVFTICQDRDSRCWKKLMLALDILPVFYTAKGNKGKQT